MLQRRYLVEVQNNRIVVRVTATSYVLAYRRVGHPPWLLPGKFPPKDDHRAPMDRLEFIRSAWYLAKDKAEQLSWNSPSRTLGTPQCNGGANPKRRMTHCE